MLVQRLFHISIVVLFRAESRLFQPTHTTKKSYKVEGEKISCKHILPEKKFKANDGVENKNQTSQPAKWLAP